MYIWFYILDFPKGSLLESNQHAKCRQNWLQVNTHGKWASPSKCWTITCNKQENFPASVNFRLYNLSAQILQTQWGDKTLRKRTNHAQMHMQLLLQCVAWDSHVRVCWGHKPCQPPLVSRSHPDPCQPGNRPVSRSTGPVSPVARSPVGTCPAPPFCRNVSIVPNGRLKMHNMADIWGPVTGDSSYFQSINYPN